MFFCCIFITWFRVGNFRYEASKACFVEKAVREINLEGYVRERETLLNTSINEGDGDEIRKSREMVAEEDVKNEKGELM